ncbi:MAG TPA: glycosyltransferase family 4 protein [Verrucomicrobiae bacterium]
MNSLKLLLVAPKPPPNGGISRWTVLLLEWLQGRSGLEVGNVDISPRWRAVDDLGIPKRLVGGGLQGLRDTWHVWKQLSRFRPQVMHLTTSGSLAALRDVLFLSLARWFGAKSVYHIRMGRLPDMAGKRNWEWRLLLRAARRADRVAVLDQASERALQLVLPKERIVRLPNAIDLKALAVGRKESGEWRAENENHRVLYLGWVVPTKGVRELMEAWRQVHAAGWELVVAGPGDDGYQRELAALAGPEGRVRFLGNVSYSGAWELVQQADIFVLPTYTEGFPNAILEAMAAGRPIVASAVGAIPEMLEADTQRPCGVLIPPRDVSALAGALRRVMADPDLRAESGRRARAKVEREYDVETVFPRLVSLWEELAGQNERG